MSIMASGETNIGMKRKTNQDSIFLLPQHNFFLVADGMGGHNGGDIASQLSTKLFPEFIKENFDKIEPVDLMSNAVVHVNNQIYAESEKNAELKGMGTTISAILFKEKHLYVANVGDSRIYMVNKAKLFQMSRDHSLVQERLNIGFYDREGAKKDPQKNVLIRTVGYELDVVPDIYQYKVSKNDLFMVCSDGLHGKVADQDIVHIINKCIPDVANATQQQLDTAVESLISQANLNGGQDNISVIIAIAK